MSHLQSLQAMSSKPAWKYVACIVIYTVQVVDSFLI